MFEKTNKYMLLEAAGLISVSNWLLSKISDKGFESLCDSLTSSNEVNENFYKAVTNASQILQNKYPEALGGSINLFFTRESLFDKLVKQLFANSVINEETIIEEFDINTLPEGFVSEYITVLKDEVSKDILLNKFLSNKEIFISVHDLNEKVTVICESSTLTLSEVTSIKKYLQDMFESKFIYSEFLEIYSKNAIHNLSQVNFIGLGVDLAIKRKRKNLQDVFVKPFLQIINNDFVIDNVIEKDNPFDADDEHNIISYSELFLHSNKLVVLGNPGSGKSVLVKSLICDVIHNNKEKGIHVLPLRVELRKYLSFKKSNGGSILKYILSMLESEYSIFNITESILHDIFKTKSISIYFDGLDEIFKIEDKIEIKNDIENFHNSYTNIQSITTSRIIGYEEAKLQEDVFCELMILSFNDEQIEEYIYKWYEKEEENEEIRNKEIDGFISKMHEIDRELVSNPLLLSLIVILYRNILKLPESKLEIYQSCTKTLVDKWDASKDLVIDLESVVYKSKEKILADLAYWQYEQLSGDSVVITYDKAKSTVIRSLKEKLSLEDEMNFETLAENFMEYAQKRSIYFDNNFTHKTFLEYYTAYWIYSNIEKKHKIKQRNDLISKYIDNSFWHIVLELLLNMIDKDQADSEIMDTLISIQVNKKTSSLPFFLSTITSFKNISAKKVSEVIAISIKKIIDTANLSKKLDYSYNRESLEYQIYEGIKSLYSYDINAGKTIFQKIVDEENSGNKNVHLYYILYLELEIFSSDERERYKFDLSNKELFKKVCNENSYLFILSTFMSSSVGDYFDNAILYIKNFGVNSIFESHSTVYEDYSLGPYINHFINSQVLSNNINKLNQNLLIFEDNGLSKLMFYNFIKESDYYYFRPETVRGIKNKIESESDILVIKMLMMLLAKTNMTNTNRMNLIDETRSDVLKKLFKLKDVKKRVMFVNSVQITPTLLP